MFGGRYYFHVAGSLLGGFREYPVDGVNHGLCFALNSMFHFTWLNGVVNSSQENSEKVSGALGG